MARPLEYNQNYVELAKGYIRSCEDEKTKDGLTVKLPTKGGLAFYLKVSRETLYAWAKLYPEFSDVMEELGSKQEAALISKGLSGDYNSTIAKVLLTKHGYREGIDTTTNDKDVVTSEAIDKANTALKAYLDVKTSADTR